MGTTIFSTKKGAKGKRIMNNLDTQTVIALLRKIFYFFKATENFLYKDGKRTEVSGRTK